MNAGKTKNAFGQWTLLTALSLVGLMVLRANFCLLGICTGEIETKEIRTSASMPAGLPACHDSADLPPREDQSEDTDKSCCSSLYAASLQAKNGASLNLPELLWLALPIIPVLNGASPAATVTVAYLDLPPPPSGPPLYLQNRSLLN